MTPDHEKRNEEIFRDLWEQGLETYESHPTSRHRRRFALNSLRREPLPPNAFLFDYGCGSGALLQDAKTALSLEDSQLGGCDITPAAVEVVKQRFGSERFHLAKFPELDRLCDAIVCMEVIEHTPRYDEILAWIFENLAPGGLLILTTPGTPMDPPDVEYGHTQHFELPELVETLRRVGFRVEFACRWGFPLFSLQKWVTKRFYRHIRKHVIESELGPLKRAGFSMLYAVYCIHDLIPAGPQIFVRARKPHPAAVQNLPEQ